MMCGFFYAKRCGTSHLGLGASEDPETRKNKCYNVSISIHDLNN